MYKLADRVGVDDLKRLALLKFNQTFLNNEEISSPLSRDKCAEIFQLVREVYSIPPENDRTILDSLLLGLQLYREYSYIHSCEGLLEIISEMPELSHDLLDSVVSDGWKCLSCDHIQRALKRNCGCRHWPECESKECGKVILCVRCGNRGCINITPLE